MTKRLLNKTTGSFLAFSVLILVVAAPVFYFISQLLYIYETDEVLLFHKGDFVKDSRNFTEGDIAAWNKYNRDVQIVPDMGVTKDSIFGRSLFDSISREKEPFRLLYAPVNIGNKRFTYIERSNLVEMEGMVISIAIMFLVIIIILLIGIILLSNRLSKRIWSPFYDTLQQIQDFEIDKNNPPNFIGTDIDEFDRLNKSLDRLIEKNTAIYKSQREFVENAAHELQTPLALFQTKLDTLSQSAGLSEEESGLIGSLNNDVSRMNRLNKNLLLLSKIDNDSYLEKQEVVLNDYIEKHLDFFTEQAASKSVTVTVDLSEKAILNTNPVLAEVLINNLFLNAIRHNTTGGKIIITTSENAIAFANSGQQIPLNAEKLFNRFSKADPSAKGNGLGLAIVKKIIELNRWDIAYSFHDGLHNFIVKF